MNFMNFAGNSNLELDLKIKKIKLELQYQKLKNHGIDPKYCTKSVSVKIVQILNHKIQSPVLDSTHWCPLEFDISVIQPIICPTVTQSNVQRFTRNTTNNIKTSFFDNV